MITTLVTGGAGFIGSHLVDYLLSIDNHVIVLDNLSTGSLGNLIHARHNKHLDVVIDSMLTPSVVDHLVARSDRVVHLAAVVGVRRLLDDPVDVIETNVQGTQHVLKACARKRCPVLVASSGEVVGKSRQIPFREDADLLFGSTKNARWSYACTKMLDELLAQAYHRQHGVPTVCVRLFNITGPRQTGENGMVIPRFIGRALAGKPVTVYGDGSQSRCFAHVDDIVPALVRLLETPSAHGDVLNLGSDEITTIRQLADLVVAETGSTAGVEYLPFEHVYGADIEDLPVRQPDLTQVRERIGFVPHQTLGDIVRDVVAYERAKHTVQDQ